LTFAALPEHLRGTFFWDKSKRFILVQILNGVELATGGEFIEIPSAEIRLTPAKLKVQEARVLWPEERMLEVEQVGKRTLTRLPRPGRYTAHYLKLA
jgi:hypothetical protein